VSLKTRSTFVTVHPSEILEALVGLKDVRVLRYERAGPHVELMVEQVLGEVRCPRCQTAARSFRSAEVTSCGPATLRPAAGPSICRAMGLPFFHWNEKVYLFARRGRRLQRTTTG
jgi:hypothetical protein